MKSALMSTMSPWAVTILLEPVLQERPEARQVSSLRHAPFSSGPRTTLPDFPSTCSRLYPVMDSAASLKKVTSPPRLTVKMASSRWSRMILRLLSP